MSKESQADAVQPTRKNGHKSEPAVLPEQTGEFAAMVKFAGQIFGANANRNIESRANQLSHSPFQTVQRQSLIRKIAQMQGNQHVQRTVATPITQMAPPKQSRNGHPRSGTSFRYNGTALIENATLTADQKARAYDLLSITEKSTAIRAASLEPNLQSSLQVQLYRKGYERGISRLPIQRRLTNTAEASKSETPASGPIAAQTQTTLPTLEQAARDLTLWFAMPYPTAHSEQIFRTFLLLKGRGEELKAAFQQNAGRDLLTAIEDGLSGYDKIRAKSYLKYGTLRLADKIYFAVEGAGTDEDTLYRLMPEVHENIPQVDADFSADYGDFAGDGKLLTGQPSRIAGVLEDQMSDWELDKAKALLTFGKLRPVDEIRIATNRWGTDEDMLFAALERSDKNTVRQEYQASYGDELEEVIDSELSGKDEDRAHLILEGRLNAFEKIRLAVKGWGTDEQAIFDAINKADPAERQQLAAQFQDHDSDFYEMLDDDLDTGDMNRVQALLLQSANDTAVQKLQQAGAVGGSDLVKEVKMSAGDMFEKYESEYSKAGSEFNKYVMDHTDEDDRAKLSIILYGSVESRLDWAMEGAGTDEDYIFHVLKNFTDDTKKRSIAQNAALMDDLDSELGTSDMNKVRDLLTLSNLSAEEKVSATGERIEREGSWITDLTSNASDALSDENRELTAALDRARADGEISPEEQAEIGKFQKETDASLEVYKTVRDEIEGTMATILSTAAAIIVGVLSAGTLSGLSAAMSA